MGAVAGVDGGGAAVDANDGAHHGLQVLVLEGHLLATSEVVARRSLRSWRVDADSNLTRRAD